jgi:hypothetical protein
MRHALYAAIFSLFFVRFVDACEPRSSFLPYFKKNWTFAPTVV